MLKIYKMPNGRTYQFEEGKAPAGAVPFEKVVAAVEAKAEKPKKRKATQADIDAYFGPPRKG